MTANSASLPAAPAPRILATPYARRLARERSIPLSAIVGSGPNGRVTGDDVTAHKPVVAQARPTAEVPPAIVEPRITESTAPAAAAVPAAIVVGVEFAAAEALLARIAELRPEVTREDICLKAAALALQASPSFAAKGAILLLAGDQRRLLTGLADASVSAIAGMRSGGQVASPSALAISFIGRPGVRPVAAQLVDGVPARLVVGAPDKNGIADCLLSYDPAKVSDEHAETWLAAFRDLVEAPFRLLV
jgi:e3 binding domain